MMLSDRDRERPRSVYTHAADRNSYNTQHPAGPPRMPMVSSSTSMSNPNLTVQGDPRFSTRIEDYELGVVIGRGGFAVVHQAVSKHPRSYGMEVAIKIIDKAVMNQSNLAERVATELQIHSNLNHPSILHMYTHFQSSTHVYLVTELCNNGELYRYIQRRNGGCLTEAEARGVLEEVVKGVLYLHSHGIIHRDLKLSNVLITRDYHVKIADFGLAVKLNNPDGEQKTMCGTPNYISPEIVSRQPYGLSSDLWSLGCMLVTILTGKPPFDSQAVKSTLDKVSRVEYYLPDSVSDEARDLIGRLLMKDPKKRLTLRDILSHKWFSYPRLALKPERSPSVASNSDDTHGAATEPQYLDQQHQHQQQILNQRQPVQPTLRTNQIHNTPTPMGRNAPMSKDTRFRPAEPTPDHQGLSAAGTQTNGQPHNSKENQSNPEATAPFNTTRLKAMHHKLKQGSIFILADGNIVVDFSYNQHLVLISSDSKQVHLCERTKDDSSAITSSATVATTPTLQYPVYSYSNTNMSPSLCKVYAYAAKFVKLVKGKTPKIMFYSPQAKCLLMENAPQPDFEMHFYNGIKVYHCSQIGKISFRVPNGSNKNEAGDNKAADDYRTYEFIISGSDFRSLDLPVELVPVFRHVQECLRQCLDIERNTEGTTALNSYPLILKSSNTGGGGGGLDSGYTGVSSKGISPAPSIHPPPSSVAYSAASSSVGRPDNTSGIVGQVKSRSSVTGTASTLYTPESKYAATTISSLSRQHGPSSRVMGAGSREDVAMKKHSASTTPTVVSSATASGQNGGSGSARRQVFLENVGWCSRDGDGRFVMLFNDGVHMIVDSRDQNLVWINASGGSREEIRYKIDKSLPQDIKAKLSHFPTFLGIFRKNK